jgi:hypothetical protein
MFAGPIGAELAPGGMLGFPDLEILQTAEQILVGSPRLLAVEYGTFSHDKLRDQATKKGFVRRMLKTAELWVSPEADTLSVAYVNEKILLVGSAVTLESEIARVADPKSRSYSPLLARGARYIKEDLWVVAAKLPDPLASTFVPFDWEATAFEGSVSVWEGLHAVAAVERSTPTRAMDLADSIATSLASRPAMAEGTEVTTHDRSVMIRMDLDEDHLAASMNSSADAANAVASAEPIHAPEPPPANPVPAPSNPAKTFVPVAAAKPKGTAPVAIVPPLVKVSPAAAAPVVAIAPIASSPAKPQAKAFVPPQVAASSTQATDAQARASITLPEVDVHSNIAITPQGSAPQSNLPPKPRVIKIVGLDDGPREILIDKVAR